MSEHTTIRLRGGHRETISSAVQDAYWKEWSEVKDHWLALAAALKMDRQEREAQPAPVAAQE